MKIHKMNKEVHHNGEKYLKGQKVKEDDGNFKLLQKAGHIETVDMSGDVEEKAEAVAPEQEEQSEQPAKPHGKSKK